MVLLRVANQVAAMGAYNDLTYIMQQVSHTLLRPLSRSLSASLCCPRDSVQHVCIVPAS
jgi:hypothetical protein